MLPYLTIWIALCTITIGATKFNTRYNLSLFNLAVGLLFLFIGMRYQVGGDWHSYVMQISQVDNDTSPLAILNIADPAYSILDYLGNRTGTGVYICNVVCAGLFMYGLSKFCQRLPNPWLALTISMPYLITVVAMGYTRQSAAFGLVLLGLDALFNRRVWSFILLVSIASLFHKTAIFTLFFLATLDTVWQKHNRKRMLALLAVTVCLSSWVLYKRWHLYVAGQLESRGTLFRLALNLPPAAIFWRQRQHWKQIWPKDYNMCLYLVIASLLALPLQFLASTAVDRMAIYLIPIQMIAYTRFVDGTSEKYKQPAKFSILALYSITYIIWLQHSTYAKQFWIPYRLPPFITHFWDLF